MENWALMSLTIAKGLAEPKKGGKTAAHTTVRRKAKCDIEVRVLFRHLKNGEIIKQLFKMFVLDFGVT